jgi:hypothetical protein
MYVCICIILNSYRSTSWSKDSLHIRSWKHPRVKCQRVNAAFEQRIPPVALAYVVSAGGWGGEVVCYHDLLHVIDVYFVRATHCGRSWAFDCAHYVRPYSCFLCVWLNGKVITVHVKALIIYTHGSAVYMVWQVYFMRKRNAVLYRMILSLIHVWMENINTQT